MSGRPSEPEKDLSPDDLLNKNIIINYPQEIQSRPNVNNTNSAIK